MSATKVLLAAFVVILLLLVYYFILNWKKDGLLLEKETEDESRMARYSTTIRNIPIFYMRMELVRGEGGQVVDTIVRDVNKSFSDNVIHEEKCCGKRGSELFPESTPTFLENIKLAERRMRPVTFAYFFENISRHISVVLVPSTDRKHVETYCMDFTELHDTQERLSESNRKLTSILDIVNIVPWKLDMKTSEISIDLRHNSNISERKRRERTFTFRKEYFFSKVHEDDRERVMKTYDDLIAGRIDVVREEFRMVFKRQGVEVEEWVSIHAIVDLIDEEGRLLGLIGALQIITTRKNMEYDLIKAKEKAEASNKLKTEFLANITHEIRTPLNAIAGFTQLMAMSGKTDEERQQFSKYIEENTETLLQIVNDALDLSNIEAGTMEFKYSNFDLNQLMDELNDTMQMKLHTDRKVTMSCNKGLQDCHINSDRERIAQLLTNMLSNAIKFTQQGSITFGYIQRDKNLLYFYVTDTGSGISKENQGDIFDRFVKLSTFKQGTGLGLSICKSIVKKMDGDIGVISEEGKGSTFWFTLPYQSALPEA